MHVLALITDAYGSNGGIAKFNRDLLAAMVASEFCSSVTAVPRLVPGPLENLPKRLAYAVNAAGSKHRFVFEALRHALRKPTPDLLVCGHINLLSVAWLVKCAIRPRPDLLLIVHGIDAWEPHKSLLVRRSIGCTDRLLAVSRFTKDRFLRWARLPPDACRILPNCVDLSAFAPGSKDPTLLQRYGLQSRRILMTLGRLQQNRDKGVDRILEVLPQIVAKDPSIAYLVVGDGSDQMRLKAKTSAMGLAEHVVFAGRISEAEKPAHYRLADAFVLPGTEEGFGIVYLEALASGVPVLGSKMDGSRDALLDGELGELVDPHDSNDVLRGILRVLEQRPGKVPSRLTEFSFERFSARVEQILQDLSGPVGMVRAIRAE